MTNIFNLKYILKNMSFNKQFCKVYDMWDDDDYTTYYFNISIGNKNFVDVEIRTIKEKKFTKLEAAKGLQYLMIIDLFGKDFFKKWSKGDK